MLRTPEFWVLVSFVIFVGLLVWKGVPGMIASALDSRAERIKAELDEAQRLREEAQALLGDYLNRRQEAEREAEAIIAQAKAEAEAYAAETRRKLTETVERRTRQAEEKIARAEDQARKEVRAAAADLAVRAAADLLAQQARGAQGAKLIEDSIAALKTRLN